MRQLKTARPPRLPPFAPGQALRDRGLCQEILRAAAHEHSLPEARPLPPGAVEELGPPGGPRIRRIRCNNPGPFTVMGTNSYLLGEGAVTLIDPGPRDEAHLAALLAAVAGSASSASW
ncbi:hypothetical protein ACFQU7_01465 [Pseudoroseomonas wenyumeiae]